MRLWAGIAITGPAGVPDPGDRIEFTARVAGDVPRSATYRWLLTGGQILEGQGTLRVQTPTDTSLTITATFEVLGLPSGCPGPASATAPIARRGSPLLMDELTRLPLREQMGRIDSLVRALRQRSSTKVFIIECFVKGASKLAISRRAKYRLLSLRS